MSETSEEFVILPKELYQKVLSYLDMQVDKTKHRIKYCEHFGIISARYKVELESLQKLSWEFLKNGPSYKHTIQLDNSTNDSSSKRNRQIYEYHINGMSLSDLAIKFNLSKSRINQIVHHEYMLIEKNIKEKQRQSLIESGKVPYDFLDALRDARIKLKYPESLETRTYNCLKRAKILDDICKEGLARYKDEYLLNIRGFGEKCLTLTKEAYELLKNKRDQIENIKD